MENSLEARSGLQEVGKSKVGVMAVVFMFYSMICAGAFGIEEMIPESGPGLTLVLLLVLPIVWGLPYALICAELGSARPVEGGSLMWVKEALGEFWFAIMVLSEAVWSLVCNTVYVVLAIGYLGKIIPLTDTQSYILKVVMVLIFFVINMLGVKDVGIVSTVISIAIIVVFAIVTVVGFMNWNANPMEPFLSWEYDTTFEHIGAGLAIGIWMYSGFDELSVIAGEVENSHKIIPKALMLVLPLIVLTYILPTAAGLCSIGDWADWTTEPDGVGYSQVLAQFIGPAAGIVFIIIAILGQASIFSVCIMTGSRCLLVLSDENFGPKGIAKLTKKRGTPYIAIICVTIVTLLLLPFSFTFLVVVDVFFMITVTILTVVAAMILKRRIPDEEVPFKIPGGKTMHTILCIVILAICTFSTLVNGTDWFLGGLIWILAIPILYVLAKWKFKGSTIEEPELYPINPKTRLGFGDVRKIGGFYMGLGVFASLSRFFIQWYEGSWAAEYYLDEYGSGLFSNFDLMLNVISIIGIVCIVVGAICWFAGKKTG